MDLASAKAWAHRVKRDAFAVYGRLGSSRGSREREYLPALG